MRWQALQLDQDPGPDQDQDPGRAAAPALFGRDAVARTFDTPGFRGMTFYEVHAKSIINRVPARPGCPSSGRSTPTGAAGTRACTASPARPTPTWSWTPARTSTQGGRQGQRPRAGPAGAGRGPVGGRPRGHGHERGLLPAGRGPLRAHAGDHRRAARRPQPVLDPDQGHADPARPRPAGGGGGADRRRPQRVRRLCRQRAIPTCRAGHAEPAAASASARRWPPAACGAGS